MGQSTNGQICFGIAFEDGYQFPWNIQEEDVDDLDYEDFDDILDWWQYVKGYTKLDSASWDERYDHKKAWDKENPLPVSLVNYCSGDYPMYILAVPSTIKSASRGYPERFDPEGLKVSQKEKDDLVEFCASHDIKYDGEPSWLLSSYWG